MIAVLYLDVDFVFSLKECSGGYMTLKIKTKDTTKRVQILQKILT